MDNLLYKKTMLRVVKLINVAMMTIPFAACWYLFYADALAAPYFAKGNWMIIALFAILYVTYGRIYDGFQISLNRISESVTSQSLAVMIADGILFVVTWLLMKFFPPVPPMIVLVVVQILMSAIWCRAAHIWYFRTFPAKRTAIIYDQREGMQNLISQYGLSKKFNVVAVDDVVSALDKDLSILDGMDAVFLCGIHSHERNVILKRCIAQDVQMYLVPRIGDVLMSGAKKMHMFHLPMLRVERYDPAPEYLFLKRAVDVIISGLALLILSPVMLIVAIAIKATDGGPVFYKQCRLTKDGKTFNVLKFRSMRVDSEKQGARLAMKHDDRITPVGRVIRNLHLDELPQLFNILKGDMSMVGPRPERPQIAEEYKKAIPEFDYRLKVKAGLTGFAQVYGKYNTTPYDKLKLDLTYIENYSFVLDIKLMFLTFKILFQKENTEGVEKWQVTAATKENLEQIKEEEEKEMKETGKQQ